MIIKKNIQPYKSSLKIATPLLSVSEDQYRTHEDLFVGSFYGSHDDNSGDKLTYSIKDTVFETGEKWQHEGKKIGKLAAAIAGTVIIPGTLAFFFPSMAGVFAGPAGAVSGLVLSALEEQKIGIGKHTVGFIGKAAGSAAGLIKGFIHKREGTAESDALYLPLESPKGDGPKKALLPKLLHKARQKKSPENIESTENMKKYGSSGATIAGTVPMLASAAGIIITIEAFMPSIAGGVMGGVPGIIAATIAGSLIGSAIGNIEENTLGAGRAAGELIGMAADKFSSPKKPEKITESNYEKEKSSKSGLKDYFISGMQFISEPLMSGFLDLNVAAGILLSEKPFQCMKFYDRPVSIKGERLTDNFIRLAGINGINKKEENIGKEICSQLNSLGISHKKLEDGTIIATIPATERALDSPTVVLCAHQDTVAETDPAYIKTDGKKIFTDEKHILGADDRSGIAQILEGVTSVLEHNLAHPEIKLVFTVEEETGATGASRLRSEDISTRPSLGFVLDSTNKRNVYLVGEGSKGSYRFSQEDPLIQVLMYSQAGAGIEPRPIHAPPMMGAQTDAHTEAFNNKMIKSIIVGTGMKDVHTSMENIKIQDLLQGAKTVMGLISNSCDLKIDENNKIIPRYPVTDNK